jgi:hypothetical protein
MAVERRKLSRRNFSYYMRVLDGFKLDCERPVPLNVDFRLRIDLTSEISNRSYISFTARAMWSQADQHNHNTYNVGFRIVNMPSADYDVFIKMFNTYGVKSVPHHKSNSNYLWG